MWYITCIGLNSERRYFLEFETFEEVKECALKFKIGVSCGKIGSYGHIKIKEKRPKSYTESLEHYTPNIKEIVEREYNLLKICGIIRNFS